MNKDVVKIDFNSQFCDALKLMHEHKIRDVVVCNNEREEIFLLSINDLLRHYLRHGDLDRPFTDVNIAPLPLVEEGQSILDVVKSFDEIDEYIGVINEDGELAGIASYTDIADGIEPRLILERITIGELVKRHIPKYVKKETSLRDLFKLFSSPSDAVIVVEEQRPVGLLTTTDSIRLISEGVDNTVPVEEYMVSPVRTIPSNISISEALDYIQNKQYKRLIVCDEDGLLMGTVTQHDLVALAYNRWSDLMKSHQDELIELVDVLKQKNSQFEKLISIDRLTGINNRTKIEDLIMQEVERNDRYTTEPPFSIMFADIDHFKKVNDQWGHLMGDSVLKQVGQLLLDVSRTSDNVGRWGGEEFIVMLPHTDIDEAAILAERLRLVVREAEFETHEQLTISIGIAQYNNGEGYRDLLRRSDQALYLAKESGRDCYKKAE